MIVVRVQWLIEHGLKGGQDKLWSLGWILKEGL